MDPDPGRRRGPIYFPKPIGFAPFITFGLGFAISSGTTFWILLEIVTMLTNPERRAFQDRIAGTVVVRTSTAAR